MVHKTIGKCSEMERFYDDDQTGGIVQVTQDVFWRHKRHSDSSGVMKISGNVLQMTRSDITIIQSVMQISQGVLKRTQTVKRKTEILMPITEAVS